MRKTLLAVLVLSLVSSAALACDDYRREIIKHVVDPCYLELIESGDLTEYMTADEALEMLKTMEEENIKEMIDAVNGILGGKNLTLEQRKQIYQFSAIACIKGISE